MNQEDKLSRLKELKKIDWASDEEIEEMQRLEEELKLNNDESKTQFQETKVELGIGKGFTVPTKKYRGLISGRIEKWRDERREQNKQPPATKEEIYQLRLELERARLQRELNITQQDSKSKRNYWEIFRTVVGTNNSPINREPQRKKKQDPVDKINKGLDHISGKNQDKDYSALF